MENTTNYGLKKPDYTDFADVYDINDNMDTIDEKLANPTGDTADSTTTFTTSDTGDGGATAWTTVPALTSGETHKSLFAKMSQMFKNIRFLYKLLGTTDISSIGNGTVTGGLSSLNDSFTKKRLNYSSYITLKSGDTSIGTYNFSISADGCVFVSGIYATELGNTTDTNNFYCMLSVNGAYIADSQSFIVRERGGSMCALVHKGDVVSLELRNHAVKGLSLKLVPFTYT